MTTKRKHPVRSAIETCNALADSGDLLGLLGFLETEASPALVHESLGMIGRCIRYKVRNDLTGLSEDAFGRIIGLSVLLMTKTQLFIWHRLQESESFGAGALPRDLTHEGWIDRLERQSRFVAEMAALRARVRHLNRLDHDSERTNKRQTSTREPTMADDRGQAATSTAAPRNGRGRPTTSTSKWADRLAGAIS